MKLNQKVTGYKKALGYIAVSILGLLIGHKIGLIFLVLLKIAELPA